jgi:hypothetical protein
VSTATIARPLNVAPPINDAPRTLKTVASSLLARIKGFYRAVVAKLRIGGIFTWAKTHVWSKATWCYGVVRTAGPLAVLTFGLSTHTGRELVLHRIPRTAYRVATWPLRFAGRGAEKVLRRMGKPGNAIVDKTKGFVERAERFVTTKVNMVDLWMTKHHSSNLFAILRSVSFWTVCSRLISRFIHVTPLRYLAYLIMVLVPITKVSDGIGGSQAESLATGALDMVLSVVGAPESSELAGEVTASSIIDAPQAGNLPTNGGAPSPIRVSQRPPGKMSHGERQRREAQAQAQRAAATPPPAPATPAPPATPDAG